MTRPHPRSLLLFLILGLAGCPVSDDDDSAVADDDDDDSAGDDDDSTGPIPVPEAYEFPSRQGADVSSVSYGGQVFRHVLIADLKRRVDGMTTRLDGGWFPAEGEVVGELDFYLEFDDGASSDIDHGVQTTPAPAQTTYGDISSGKDLLGKLAGNDPVGQHVDWSTGFVGWGDAGTFTPETLVRAWFDQLEDQAIDWSNGTYPLAPDGTPVSSVAVTADGLDLGQLLQKFLLGAVAFSQGADDYLDDDTEGKGLLADHTALEDGAPYTALEHAWDEGFGYFGAARTYADRDDAAIADTPWADADGDGAVDLLTEYTFGHAQNAAKRDNCGDCTAPTDFSGRAFDAFLAGRTLITNAPGPLTGAELETLRTLRDQALTGWEAAIAATAVHYINDTLADYANWDSEPSFEDLAKHWSELKGFALSFQFNPHSPLSDTDFATLHGYIGDAPVSPEADTATIEAYLSDLRAARALLGTAYSFPSENLGDEDGAGGW